MDTLEPWMLELASKLDTPAKRAASQYRSRRRRRRLLAVCSITLVGSSGVAIAAVTGAFDGISSTQAARTPSDALDAQLAGQIQDQQGINADSPVGVQQTEGSRLLATLPHGERVYVMPSSKHKLCVVLALPKPSGVAEVPAAVSCGDPLSTAVPATLAAFTGPTGTIVYGVARDGVVSVSFPTADGRMETIPVAHNVFAAPSVDVADRGTVVATLADGSVAIIR